MRIGSSFDVVTGLLGGLVENCQRSEVSSLNVASICSLFVLICYNSRSFCALIRSLCALIWSFCSFNFIRNHGSNGEKEPRDSFGGQL